MPAKLNKNYNLLVSYVKYIALCPLFCGNQWSTMFKWATRKFKKKHIASPPPSYLSKISGQCYLFWLFFDKPLQMLDTDPMYITKKFRNTVVFSIWAFQGVFLNITQVSVNLIPKADIYIGKKWQNPFLKAFTAKQDLTCCYNNDLSLCWHFHCCVSAVTWSRSLWPDPSYPSPPAPFPFFPGLLHHKDCIRLQRWSWPRLRRLHDLKSWVSEGKPQGSFNTLIIFQSLILPPHSE